MKTNLNYEYNKILKYYDFNHIHNSAWSFGRFWPKLITPPLAEVEMAEVEMAEVELAEVELAENELAEDEIGRRRIGRSRNWPKSKKTTGRSQQWLKSSSPARTTKRTRRRVPTSSGNAFSFLRLAEGNPIGGRCSWTLIRRNGVGSPAWRQQRDKGESVPILPGSGRVAVSVSTDSRSSTFSSTPNTQTLQFLFSMMSPMHWTRWFPSSAVSSGLHPSQFGHSFPLERLCQLSSV